MVFTTGMVGYTKTLTDPSYCGQILVFTYPLLGNYGVPSFPLSQFEPLRPGFESHKIHAAGVILADSSERVFHWKAHETLDQWLKAQGVPGLIGVDTRYLAQIIRSSENCLAKLVPSHLSKDSLPFNDPNERNLLPQVSIQSRTRFGKGDKRIAVVDCGAKWNIIRDLIRYGCEVEVLPWDTDFDTVDCSAWLISNGPGDPKNTGNLIPRIQTLLNQDRPIFGICLGYQLLALASGANTKKLEFGHRGHNQPVLEIETQQGFMTSQNHGFVVIEETLPEGWRPWFRNINDGTLEGLTHREKPFKGVQFHPEASAGPRDASVILEKFIQEEVVA
jgi:carbamoyl-phosphate synthase small subunit